MSKVYWQFPTRGVKNAKHAAAMPARGVTSLRTGEAPPTGTKRSAPKSKSK